MNVCFVICLIFVFCYFFALSGLIVGDEILVINGKVIAELDMVYVENILQEMTSVTLTIRSCRIESPVNTTVLMEHADMYIDNMMCPPPPSQSRISDKVIDELIVPAPNWGKLCLVFILPLLVRWHSVLSTHLSVCCHISPTHCTLVSSFIIHSSTKTSPCSDRPFL